MSRAADGIQQRRRDHLKKTVTAGQNDGPLTVPRDAEIRLNLNGCYINRGLENAEARSDGCVIINNGKLTIKDSHYGYKGRITGGNNSEDGGGIYNAGELTLSGGQIQENKALGEDNNGQGGGILQNGTMNVSGNPIVKNNAANQGDNIYLRADHPTMTVKGAFTEGAFLGVTGASGNDVITSDYSRYNGEDKDPQFIFNSDEGYLIRLINNEVKIVRNTNLVRYFIRSWDGSKVVSSSVETDEYKLMSDVKDSGSTQLQTGLYVARNNLTFKNRISIAPGAEVTLVLCDSANLTMEKGIRLNGSGCKLIICGQIYDSGVLEAKSGSDAPIGADSKKEGGTIEVHGGTVIAKAKGENPSAAIGGAKKSPSSGKILIYGGNVHAVAGDGAAIGGGASFIAPNQECGGYGPIEIYGGIVNAQAAGAGIGAGNNIQNPHIEINGGEITAICKANGESGAGIGSGRYADQIHHIVINDGEVIATSEGGAGIGAGARYNGGTIDINDGVIIATSTNGGAGIGGGRRGGNGGTVTIKNGWVMATALKTNEGADMQNRFNRMAKTFKATKVNKRALTGAMMFQVVSNIIRAASGDESGAGIGGGYKGKGSQVEITGGYVVASASTGKARAIGHGTSNSSVGTLSLHKGAAVYTGKDADSAAYTLYEDRETACQSNRYALILPCLHEDSTVITTTETTHTIHCLYCTQLSEFPEPHEWNETRDHCVICNYHVPTPQYTIRYDLNGGEGDPSEITIADGDEYELPSYTFTPPDGKTFDQWLVTIGTKTPVLKKPGQKITVTDDIIVQALWKNLYTVTFVTEDDAEGRPPAQTVVDGEKAVKPDNPTREGYTFRCRKLQGSEKEYDFNNEVSNDSTGHQGCR